MPYIDINAGSSITSFKTIISNTILHGDPCFTKNCLQLVWRSPTFESISPFRIQSQNGTNGFLSIPSLWQACSCHPRSLHIYGHRLWRSTCIPKRRYMKPPYLAAKSRKVWCGSFLLELIVGKFPRMGHAQGPGGFLGAWYRVTNHHSVMNSTSSAGNGTCTISCFQSCQRPWNCLHHWSSSACALDMAIVWGLCKSTTVDCDNVSEQARKLVTTINRASQREADSLVGWVSVDWDFRCYLISTTAWRHLLFFLDNCRVERGR